MKTIHVRNVNEALYVGTMLMSDIGLREVSPRGARTIEYPGPVSTTYERPWERVLFSLERNANPFFHLMESLWILAGRQDVGFLEHYNKRMREFSDDGTTFHAPYGYRIAPQIPLLLDLFDKDIHTRRAALQIWDWGLDLNQDSRDIPCNDMVFFKVRSGELHMTVANRSNDMIWGAYGANAVQFSMLQEYIASILGVGIGTYTQVSDSFHIYLDGPGGQKWQDISDQPGNLYTYTFAYEQGVCHLPFLHEPEAFQIDCRVWFMEWDHGNRPHERTDYESDFFRTVVVPMAQAWDIWKETKDPVKAVQVLYDVENISVDWIVAGFQWFERKIQ